MTVQAAHALADAEAWRAVRAEQAEAFGVIHRPAISPWASWSSRPYRAIQRSRGQGGRRRFGFAAGEGQSGYQESA
jgi:hypothetical protein